MMLGERTVVSSVDIFYQLPASLSFALFGIKQYKGKRLVTMLECQRFYRKAMYSCCFIS